MKFKIDENLPRDIAGMLTEAGHDASTVGEQGLSGENDDSIARVVARERRCLVTQDLDFSNILAYPPGDYHGIIVLRPPAPSRRWQVRLAAAAIQHLRDSPVSGAIWIVEPSRIRVHEGDRGSGTEGS